MKEIFQKKYKKHRFTISNFIWRSLQLFGKEGISLSIFALCVLLLTPEEIGIYSYLLAFVFLLILFSDFGISKATSIYVTKYNIVDKEKLQGVLFNSFLVVLSISLIVFLFFFLFGSYFLGDYFKYAIYVFPLVFLPPLTALYDGIYRGFKKFKKLSIITITVGLVALIPVYFLISSYGLEGALLSQSFFYLIWLIGLFLGHRDFTAKYDLSIMKTIVSYSFFIGISSMALFLYTKVDIIVLGQFDYIEEIAHYEIVNKVVKFVLLPQLILSTIIAPTSVEHFALKRYSYIKKKLFKESSFLFVAGLFVTGMLYIVSPYLFENFLKDYDTAILLQILSLFLLILPIKYFSGYVSSGYITPGGYVKILTVTTLVFGLLNVVLNLLFIESFGFIGVIYATIISQMLAIVVNLIFFALKLRGIS